MSHSPADLVNPYIGTISHLLKATVPEVMLPYSYVRSYPAPATCDDYYCNDRTLGFPAGSALFLPGDQNGIYYDSFDHVREKVRCYQSKIYLDDSDIRIKSTVTRHCYCYEVKNASCIKITLPQGSEIHTEDGLLKLLVKASALGKFADEYVIFYSNQDYGISTLDQTTVRLSFAGRVEFYCPVSFISFAKAEESYRREVGKGGKTVSILAQEAKEVWNQLLRKIRVSGNSKDKRAAFYTALYRAFQRMTNYGEYGQYYSGYDRQVHDGDYFYTNDGLWDTFRCMHPLQLLLDPDHQKDIVDSYNLMYRQSGLMPSFPQPKGDAPVMLGFHAAALFADSAVKGLEADYRTAYEGIYKNATQQSMLPWVCDQEAGELDQCYYEKGFFPALQKGERESAPGVHPYERRQSISVTLEHAYDDWCAAQLAKHLGKEEDYQYLMGRSQNYKNLYRKEIGMMAPKDIHGNWVEDFNPKWGGGQGGRDFCAENNTYVYTWSVFHDPEGLAELMGGKEAAVQNLDRLFTEGFSKKEDSKFVFLGQFPDATGLMGQFPMGNEPAFHIPYLYDYYGAPWKAQKRLRSLMDIWFTNTPTGICGDEDGGAMSSWFVFSAMGFYPVCPGSGEYALGTPLFDSVSIQLDNGNIFTVKSKGAREGKPYIQSAYLNGKALERPFLTHEELLRGGELVLTMSKKPHKCWNG